MSNYYFEIPPFQPTTKQQPQQHNKIRQTKTNNRQQQQTTTLMIGMDSLSFITDICGVLKTIKRTGWVMHQIPFPESDADHMHRCAMCAMLLSQPADPRDDYHNNDNDNDNMQRFHPTNVDTNRLLRMTLTHDVCEALAGDITPFCHASRVTNKHATEEKAMQTIQKLVGDPLGCELYNLWKEYEEQQTVEAIYAKDIDKFEMVVQAYEYEKMHLQMYRATDSTIITTTPKTPTPTPTPALAPDDPDDGTTTTTTTTIKNGEHNNNNGGNGIMIINVPSVTSSNTTLKEPLRRFFISTNAVLQTPLFRRLDRELRERREAMLKEKGWVVTEEERQQIYKDQDKKT